MPRPLLLFFFFCSLLLLPGSEAATLTIINNCSYTVWPVIVSDAATTGFSLDHGSSKSISVPSPWSGNFWARTFCSSNSSSNFSCLSGDCGTGVVSCSGSSFFPPATFAKFTLYGSGGLDFYSVSLVEGFNLPMLVTPRGGSGPSCNMTGCVADLNAACPSQLRVKEGGNSTTTVACRSACDVFNTPEDCCTGAYGTPDTCKATSYVMMFKKACPRAYVFDDASSVFTCGGSPNYTITLCPSPATSLNAMPPPPPPPPPPPTRLISPFLSIPPTNSTTKPSLHNSPSTTSKKKLRTSLTVAFPTATLLLILVGICVYTCRKKAMKENNVQTGEIRRLVDSLQFDFNTIRSATHDFAEDNKLGRGGFGDVFKGKLEDGQEIAVKRLSKNSVQGIAEFETEIVLVAKLQHKNLVKLLGYCAAAKESLLVYEFLPNSSLDRFLFDPVRKSSLDWHTRLKIIAGFARGLLYLHEDSRLKVIHRDLKTSNILLDEAMNPKISDFGLARLFGVDQTQGDTKRIVGTYGYMAPEYAMTGHYSVQSDVYSFGVIVLEIVSGQRNQFVRHLQLGEALLHRAWRLWNEDEAVNLIDTDLGDNFEQEEVLKCIQIGLLCIQENAIDRPRMASIVAALNGQAISLPTPKLPHFFGWVVDGEAQDNVDEYGTPYVHSGAITISNVYSRD